MRICICVLALIVCSAESYEHDGTSVNTIDQHPNYELKLENQYMHEKEACVGGYKFRTFSDMTVEECAILCNAKEGCNGFEYFVPGRGSYGGLKARDCRLCASTNTNKYVCSGSYFGTDFYSKSKYSVDNFTQMKNACSYGNNIKLFHDITEEDCATLCYAEKGCYGFEYFVAGHATNGGYKPCDCQLNSSSNTNDCDASGYNVDFYKLKSSVTAENFPIAQQYDRKGAACVNGNKIKKFSDMTCKECGILCNAEDDCVGYEFFIPGRDSFGGYKARDCHLSSSSNTNGCNGSYYGTDFYSKSYSVDNFTHMKNTCVAKSNIRKFQDLTVEECATLCNAEKGCVGFEYFVPGHSSYGVNEWGPNKAMDCQLNSSTIPNGCNGSIQHVDFYSKIYTSGLPGSESTVLF